MILLMGPTGSGKSTQGQMLADKYGMEWASIGQLLRGHLSGEDKQMYEQGELVATDTAVQVLDDFMARVDPDKRILLDGMPRNTEQVGDLDELLDKHHRRLEAVIYISVPKSDIYQRLESRGRSDDPAVERKLAIFEEQTLPAVEAYKQRGLLHEVNGVGSVDEVYSRVGKVVDGIN